MAMRARLAPTDSHQIGPRDHAEDRAAGVGDGERRDPMLREGRRNAREHHVGSTVTTFEVMYAETELENVICDKAMHEFRQPACT
jgi:hypothetical protein